MSARWTLPGRRASTGRSRMPDDTWCPGDGVGPGDAWTGPSHGCRAPRSRRRPYDRAGPDGGRLRPRHGRRASRARPRATARRDAARRSSGDGRCSRIRSRLTTSRSGSAPGVACRGRAPGIASTVGIRITPTPVRAVVAVVVVRSSAVVRGRNTARRRRRGR